MSADSFAHGHTAGHVIGGGRYSLHVPLGETNQVWLAQDEVDQRLVAIRFIPAALREDVRAFDALKQRVSAAAAVQHPNVCRILEWYEAPGVDPFVAMEYVEGQPLLPDLTARLAARLPWVHVAPVASAMANGLAALHAAGAIHHGVHPANVMVAAGEVTLLNAVATGVLLNPLFAPSALQRPHALRCFSPQQLNGEPPTTADDYYSFGATLYELLTGSPVFGDAATLLADIVSKPAAPLTTPNNDVPPAAAEFIMACLSKSAADRPTSFEPMLIQPASAPIAASAVAPEAERKVVPLVVDDAPERTALMKHAPTTMPKRSVMPWLAATASIIIAAGVAGAWLVKQSNVERQRVAAVEAEAQRLRVEAEQQKQQAALLAEKQQQESAARARAEAELKRKLEQERQAQLAAAAEERARKAAAARLTATELVKKAVSPLVPSTTNDGFSSLFNGRDLSEWSGDTNLWSVLDGVITGQLLPGVPTKQRFYLISNKGRVEDFELRFSYRFRVLRGNKQPNAGVVYRAATNGAPELSGYQFDLALDARNNGAVNEDKKRYRIAGYGEAAIARANDKSQVLEQVTQTNALNAVRAEDWNQSVIIARGNHLTHYINGLLVADVIDENTKKLHPSGLIALELYSRNTNNPATFVQFRDLRLKKLARDSALVTAAK